MWNKQIETMTDSAKQALQLERLKITVRHAYNNVPFYKKRFDDIGLKPEHICTLKDIEKIPLTTKDDLRENYPYGMFAVPMKDIVRIHASSGTTGKPTVVGYTKADLDMWSECVARLAVMGGATDEDVAQISFGYGLFTGAFGLHYGLEKIGASIIPMSGGNTEKQVMLLKDFQPTLLISTPSYALYISEVMEKMGVSPSDIKLRVGLFGAEGSTVEMQKQLEKRFDIIATENYGLSEVLGPGVSGECPYKNGMHINDDNFYTEIIDPQTSQTLPYGHKGEMVITPINKFGFPVLRYRTKDITRFVDKRCECGRTMQLMEKVSGRSDDMLIIKGVNVFPSQIEGVVCDMKHISPHYLIYVTKKGFVDDMEVHVELADESLLESFSALEDLKRDIGHRLATVLGLRVPVKLLNPSSIQRSTGKAKRVMDLRNKN